MRVVDPNFRFGYPAHTGYTSCSPENKNFFAKRHSKAAGLSSTTSPHSWRGSGFTENLRNGGSLETAQKIAVHESSRTTKPYDRSQREITLDEIERVPAV